MVTLSFDLRNKSLFSLYILGTYDYIVQPTSSCIFLFCCLPGIFYFLSGMSQVTGPSSRVVVFHPEGSSSFVLSFQLQILLLQPRLKRGGSASGQETEGASRVGRQGYTISTYTTNILKSIKQVRNQNKEKERKSEGKSRRRPNRIWWKSKRD